MASLAVLFWLTSVLLADFALLQTQYVLACLLQQFPTLRLADGENVELIGAEKLSVTLVLSIKDGCKVML